MKTIDEKEMQRRGEMLISILGLKKAKGYADRVNTEWGTKTALGVYRMVERIILDGE